jgi:hypothetical protein
MDSCSERQNDKKVCSERLCLSRSPAGDKSPALQGELQPQRLRLQFSYRGLGPSAPAECGAGPASFGFLILFWVF